MSRRRLNTNGKIIVACAITCLIALLGAAFLGNITDGFQKDLDDVSLRERNELNLLTGAFTDFNDGNGVSAKGRNDGSIVLGGENLSESDIVIPVEKVTLAAGTYTVSGAKSGGNTTYHIAVKYVDGSGSTQTAIGDFTSKTFTITSQQEVEVTIVVKPDANVKGVLVKPVLVQGEDVGDFYA